MELLHFRGNLAGQEVYVLQIPRVRSDLTVEECGNLTLLLLNNVNSEGFFFP